LTSNSSKQRTDWFGWCTRPVSVLCLRRSISSASRSALSARLGKFDAAQSIAVVRQGEPVTVTVQAQARSAVIGQPLASLLSASQSKRGELLMARVNGDASELDLHQLVRESTASVEFVTASESATARVALAHTTAHLLGHALEQTFDEVSLLDGPASADGSFHYDCAIASGQTVTADALPELQAIVSGMIARGHAVELKRVPLDVARDVFAANPFKLQLIERIGKWSPTVDVYRVGEFVDLCAGPHVPSLRSLRADAVRLHSVSGTHVANEQRVAGVAFADAAQLAQWQRARDDAAVRDHRRIGAEQELFLFSEYSPGGVMMLPAGQRIRYAIQRELRREYRRRGYEEVTTPQIFEKSLWERSGHWDNYRDDMFEVIAPSHGAAAPAAQQRHFLKPMNCPSHCVMFGRKVHSHRELPVRYADFGALHRNELTGALRGLTRLRRFCQDDAHIFCAPNQVADEVLSTLDFIATFYAKLGFDTSADGLKFALSTRPQSSIGDAALWAAAEGALSEALQRCEHTRGRWQESTGDGAFYGPKIDVTLRDAAGRWHQCGTVQLDYNLPQRFNLLYQDAQQRERHVVMIHRAVCGSLERMLGVLTEHHAGRWPLWLAPCRAVVVPVHEAHREYAANVARALRAMDSDDDCFEVRVDAADLSLSKRVRNATAARVPYVVVVGDSDVAQQRLSVRRRGSNDAETMTLAQLIDECKRRVAAFE